MLCKQPVLLQLALRQVYKEGLLNNINIFNSMQSETEGSFKKTHNAIKSFKKRAVIPCDMTAI